MSDQREYLEKEFPMLNDVKDAGLKEKALGALRAGITTIIMPEKNKRDLAEIPANVKRKIRFLPVREMSQVLESAIEDLK